MNFFKRSLTMSLLVAGGAALMGAAGAASAAEYEVTATNLARGQQFTPILVATHKASVRLFELGPAASPQLKTLSERS